MLSVRHDLHTDLLTEPEQGIDKLPAILLKIEHERIIELIIVERMMIYLHFLLYELLENLTAIILCDVIEYMRLYQLFDILGGVHFVAHTRTIIDCPTHVLRQL